MAHLSYHAGTTGKMTQKSLKGLTGHTFRKSEGRYRNHSNDMIDTDRTKHNIDWTIDGRTIDKIVDDRIENEYTGKRKLRKDAVVAREIMVQPSADMFEGMGMDKRVELMEHFMEDSLEWFKDEFTEKNVIGYSAHMDETNPHAHVVVMPMTDDGRMAQKDFFKGPSDLKRQHREFRQHMVDKGWEFELENKYENVDGVSLPNYKANAKELEKKRQEQKEMMAELSCDPDIREEARQNVEAVIFDGVLAEERERLDEREEKLKLQAEKLEKRKEVLEKYEQALRNENDKLDEREEEVKQSERIVEVSGVVMVGLLDGNPKYNKLRNHIDKNGVDVLGRYSNKVIGDLVQEQMSNARLGDLKYDTIKKTHETIVQQDNDIEMER